MKKIATHENVGGTTHPSFAHLVALYEYIQHMDGPEPFKKIVSIAFTFPGLS